MSASSHQHGPPVKESIRSRVTFGAIAGLFVASAGLLIGAARIGLALLAGRRFHFGLSDALVLFSYPAGFVIAGAVVGALYPMRRHWIGAFLLGITGAFIFFGTVFVAAKGSPTSWTRKEWLVLSLSAAILGVMAAFQFRRLDRKSAAEFR